MLGLGSGVYCMTFLLSYPAAPLRRGIAARFSLSIPRRPFAAGYHSAVFPFHTPPALCGGVSRRGFPFPYPAAPLRRGIAARFSLSIPRRPFAAGYRSAVFPFHTPNEKFPNKNTFQRGEKKPTIMTTVDLLLFLLKDCVYSLNFPTSLPSCSATS